MKKPETMRPAEVGVPPPLPALFTRYQHLLSPALRKTIPTDHGSGYGRGDQGSLCHMMAYHMGWADQAGWPVSGAQSQGKALRPTLCLFACESLGGDCAQACPAALALELVHNFSLVHDDIQDGDVERRHQPTVWYLWGQPRALVAGNALRSIADRTALALSDLGVALEKSLRASQLLTEAYLQMVQGQCMDLSFEGRLDVRTADYLEMVSCKTGALIRCGMEMGALVASDEPAWVRAYAYAGAHLGTAFQIRDDVLGIWGDQATTGKAAGNDILRKKKSFPVVYALEVASGASWHRLSEVYSKAEVTQEDVLDVLAVLDDVGAEAYAQKAAEERAELALQHARSLPLERWAASEFEDLVEFLTYRRY